MRTSSLAERLASRRRAIEEPTVAEVSVGERIKRARRKNPNPDVQEMQRICDLPIEPVKWTPEQVDIFTYKNALAEVYERGWRFFEPQARAIDAYDRVAGGLYAIGVGWGKTGISVIIADRAWKKGKKRILLLVPPAAQSQLTTIDLGFWRKHVPIAVPFHNLSGRTPSRRLKMVQSGRGGCYIMPYSLLSSKDTIDLLKALDPEVVIADETHKIKNFSAARTRRMMAFLTGREPEFICMSGTITDRSLDDYHHLAVAALHDGAPLPLSRGLMQAWGAVLDSKPKMPTEAQAGALMPLIEWAQDHFPEETFEPTRAGFRKAFRFRLVTTPGVVATGDSEIGTSLTLSNLDIPGKDQVPGWMELMKWVGRVQDEYVTPNGDEIQHAMHTHKWLSELAAGFYNELIWPEPEVLAERKGISLEEASSRIDQSITWHRAWQKYSSELRAHLLYGYPKPGVDTPEAVGTAIRAGKTHGMPSKMVALWHAAKDLDFDERVERDARAIRVCPFRVRHAVEWAETTYRENKREPRGSILWYYHQEIGEWLCELLRERDLPLIHAPAGSNEELLADKAERNKQSILVVSISAHNEAKNMQYMQEQYVLQWPRSAKIAEQMLGRCHRNGQEADELIVHRADVLRFDTLNFAHCLNDAVYRQQTTGNRQKMVYCRYDPLPLVLSPEFLREQGFRPRDLTPEQREMMEEHFGGFSDELI